MLSALSLILIGAALAGACGGGVTVDPGPTPPPPSPPPPPPPANRAPAAATAIPDQMVVQGQTVTVDISASFSDPDGDALSHAATTSNSEIATVSLSGTALSVTGVAHGAAAVTVTASDPGGLSATQSFAVEVAALAPTIVTVTPDTAMLTAIGQRIQLHADVHDQLGRPITGAAVVWSSGDTTVATVDRSGLVTAAANGSATVTALAGEVSDSASIVVSQTATAVEITPETHTLPTGDTVRLVATATDDNGYVVSDAAFRWSSSDTAVASVDSVGLVRGVTEGTATITATVGDAADDLEGMAEITVLPPPPPVNRAPTPTTAIPDQMVVEGQTVTIDISASFSDPDGDALSHVAATSNSGVATVALSGTELSVTGVAQGTAAVTVTAADPGGLSASQSFAVEVAAPAPTPPPPDLTGMYYLESLVGTSTGGTRLTRPTISGTLELTQEAPTGDSAVGTYEVNITTPAVTITDEGTFTVRTDGSWRQTGRVSGEGTYAISGDTLTLAITEPETAASTTLWVMGTPPAPGTWRGLVVAPESRCSEYDVDQYRHPDSLEDAVAAALGDKLYEAYTGVYYDHPRDVQVDHIVAKREAHDSGACAWAPSARRAFARDIENLALASPTLDLGVKAGHDAAEWLPDFNRCWYAGAIVAVRLKYALTVDEAERDALEGVLSGCDSTELVFAPESWTVEAITLGDDSGWQALSPNEPDLNGLGVASHVAVFCTSAAASVDFVFVAGGARLAESEANYESGRLGYRSRVNIEWYTPPPRALERITVDQYPHWDNWTARLSPAARDAFIHGLVVERQTVFVSWLLQEGEATTAYEGGTDAGETILDILQRCAGSDGDLTTLLSSLARNPTAIRGRR